MRGLFFCIDNKHPLLGEAFEFFAVMHQKRSIWKKEIPESERALCRDYYLCRRFLKIVFLPALIKMLKFPRIMKGRIKKRIYYILGAKIVQNSKRSLESKTNILTSRC
jgi:hypothetical protein